MALRGDAEATMAGLARLELLGYLERSFAGSYTRTALARPTREGAAPPLV